MRVKPPRLGTLCRAVFVGDAILLPVLFYADGNPTLGGALLLSGVLVFGVFVIKSGRRFRR